MRRLHPEPAPVDPNQLIPESLRDVGGGARPYVVANFVSSADGRVSVDGGSTGLGDDGDKQIFRALRGCAGAVLVGTGTLEAEQYGTLSRHPTVVALRERLGLARQPPLVTITRSGRLPEIPLLKEPAATLIVYSGADIHRPEVAATLKVERRSADGLTPQAVLADLADTYGVQLLLCEGGPSLFGSLVVGRLCDELFLTLAPVLAGGGGPPITGPVDLSDMGRMRRLWTLAEGESLYLRYAINA
jgi:5-amino-6-(5-phosphoribosylamino)uracil reductase